MPRNSTACCLRRSWSWPSCSPAIPRRWRGRPRPFEPHRLTSYLQELAAQFHSYYNRNRVLSEDAETSRARLYLVNAVRVVLENGLGLLGVSAPEKM